ncbi:transcriptional regulator family: C2H2 zinc finger [Paecilomyces variotii]|nr:transcriptional regulator family: C2H2 zinc finger [Paecilomyces variotii]
MVLTCSLPSPRPQHCDCGPQGPHEVPSGYEFLSRAAVVSLQIALFFPSPSSKLQGSSRLTIACSSTAVKILSLSHAWPFLRLYIFGPPKNRRQTERGIEQVLKAADDLPILCLSIRTVPQTSYGDEHTQRRPRSPLLFHGGPTVEDNGGLVQEEKLRAYNPSSRRGAIIFNVAGAERQRLLPGVGAAHRTKRMTLTPAQLTRPAAMWIIAPSPAVPYAMASSTATIPPFAPSPIDSHEGQSLEALLGEDIQLNWDTPGFLPSTSAPGHESSQAQKPEDPFHHHTVDFRATDELFASLSTPAHNAQHHDSCHSASCQAPSKESNAGLSDSYSSQSDLASLGTCDMLGVGHGYLSCGHHIHGVHPLLPDSNMEKFFGLPPSVAAPCSNAAHQHLGNRLRTPAATGVHGFHGVCRSHAHGHTHCHSHPYMPYARHHRSSVSSHLMSSPADTPPPLEGGISSGLTSPTFPTDDHEPHVCKWTFNHDGMKIACGASFADAGALQEHLISKHMGTMDGRKGHGYYCCWEGCHRPDEPFSQKSKLQGHFLTHSNFKSFKCSVCSKPFARQATLERHERSHRGEKPYKCRECGKAFTDSSELKTHSRTHSGEKPFKCNYPGCTFQTGDSSNMSSHKLTHGERRHKCQYPGCTKSFTRPDQLKRHLRTTHKDERGATLTSPMAEQFMTAAFDSLA